MTIDLTLFGLVLAFGGGLVSFLSPCVLPLVPGYVAWVAGTDLATARAERWRALRLSAFFVLGFGLVFVLLGLGATAIGGLLRRWSNELTVVAGLLIAAMGLVQMGLLRVAPLMRDLRFRPPGEGGGPVSATLIGVAFGFGWTPCIGPVLAGVLTAAALTARRRGRGCSPPMRSASACRSCWRPSTCRRRWPVRGGSGGWGASCRSRAASSCSRPAWPSQPAR